MVLHTEIKVQSSRLLFRSVRTPGFFRLSRRVDDSITIQNKDFRQPIRMFLLEVLLPGTPDSFFPY